ncbi:phosphopantetheine-binding protein [Kitasatospora kifunensis]|uniref:Acyl carrier protein n=1 Tax=Kitasatospora kifunensis TaxID=58351 RepID=A0A7W7R8K2_KITKI|nr:phosphopantetheine-binding protein [Kitasatospora kifunensis]MBB4927260.1 acyl carrier protein [Kitasatospora kifunensis]
MTTMKNATIDASELPELIASFYRETLGDQSLDTTSDFYEAGGDSLSAFQITARLQDALGLELPVALVFAYPSPEDLAAVVVADADAAAADAEQA